MDLTSLYAHYPRESIHRSPLEVGDHSGGSLPYTFDISGISLPPVRLGMSIPSSSIRRQLCWPNAALWGDIRSDGTNPVSSSEVLEAHIF